MSAPPAATPSAPESAVTETVEAIANAADQEVTFSLALSQDQKDIRDWAHGFAADVIRPGGARVGRAGADAVADHPGGREDRPVRLRGHGAVLRRPHGADAADGQRGAVLGRCGHRHGDHGHRPARRGDLRAGHARADRRMDPALLRHARRRQGGRVLRVGAERRLGRLGRAHGREVRRGGGRVGAQRPEGVGDQRRHRRRPRGDRVGRSRAGLQRPRGVRSADERGQGHLAGQQGLKARPARVAHRRRVPR